MKKYFVIGNPINHSLSPKLHNYWLKENNIDAIYDKKKIEEKNLQNIISEVKEKKINGINVTVPFKKLVIPYLDKLSREAEQTQSVNTIILTDDNLVGHNTDIAGFTKAIKDLNFNIEGKKIFILGAGGVVPSIIFALNSYLQDIENYDTDLPEIQKRLFFLKNLERTFSLGLPQLIEKRDQLKTYFQQNDQGNEICKIKSQIENLQNNLNSLFVIQSNERKKIAKLLQNSVISILSSLGLENANFSIQFSEGQPSRDGIDNINFLFSANPDKKLAPLSNVISGGEMSRFLLAIKSSISKKPNTFFLDEIDNGLSGKSLFSLVELIKEISKDQQVLCITHQPFLAAGGLAHFKVHKNVIDGTTYTSISKLATKKQRKNELIELIGGGSSEVNEYASRLLDQAAA